MRPVEIVEKFWGGAVQGTKLCVTFDDLVHLVVMGREPWRRATGFSPSGPCACVGCPHEMNCRCHCEECAVEYAAEKLVEKERQRCIEAVSASLPRGIAVKVVAAIESEGLK